MTDWKESIKARSGYVLYLEHDGGPHGVSIHDSLSGAEAALREIASGILATGGEDLPNDRDIVEKLAEYGEYARIYKCDANDGDGDRESVDVVPFLLVDAIEVKGDDETANKTAA